jgi:hypothetical protein
MQDKVFLHVDIKQNYYSALQNLIHCFQLQDLVRSSAMLLSCKSVCAHIQHVCILLIEKMS